MRYLFLLPLILIVNFLHAQDYNRDSLLHAQDSLIYLSPYRQNFEVYRTKHQIVLEGKNINLPINRYYETFSIKRDTNYEVEIEELQIKSEFIKVAGYTLRATYNFNWVEYPKGAKEIYSKASMQLDPWKGMDLPAEDFLDKLLFTLNMNDSLRYKLHRMLRLKHEEYIKTRLGISINVKDFLASVEKIYLYEWDNGEQLNKKELQSYKLIFKDTTFIEQGKPRKVITGKDKDRIVELLSNESEFMTPYRTMGYNPNCKLLLSNRNNEYIGSASLSGPSSPFNGYSFAFKISKNYYYTDYALSYKAYDELRSLINK